MDRIIIMKKDKEIAQISVTDIRLITYSSISSIKWAFECWFSNVTLPPPPRAFDIRMKNNNKLIRLWLKKTEFNKVKDLLQCPVQVFN